MGMCVLGDILQSKVDELPGDIEGVKTYIDDIIILIKDRFKNHIEKMRIIFVRLRTAGLKVNTSKRSFGLKDIPDLGYVITREVLNLTQKKYKGSLL